MNDKEFWAYQDQNEEFQREQAAGERRSEYMQRILAASPRVQRCRTFDFVLKQVREGEARGISADDSMRRLAEDGEMLKEPW